MRLFPLLTAFLIGSLCTFLALNPLAAGESRLLMPCMKTDLAVGKTLRLVDLSYYREMADADKREGLRSPKVRLFYSRDQRTDVATNGHWKLRVDYTLYPTSTLGNQESGSLEVVFDPVHSVYEALIPHQMETHDVKLEITGLLYSVSTDGGQTYGIGTAADVPNDVVLELIMDTEYYEEIDPLANYPKVYYDATDQKIRWSYVQGAEEYEVEWVYVDAQDAASASIAAASDAFEFKAGTRIRTSKNNFELDPHYGEGVLYFRARSLSRFVEDVTDGNYERVYYSAWNSTDASGTNAQFAIAAGSIWEKGKNWQVMHTFAEDGLHQTGMSYLDGSMRSRQALTRLNTQQEIVVNESKFDSEGRAAVTLLPAIKPGANGMHYVTNFTLDQANNQVFGASNFENKAYESLGDASGAGWYYSGNNSLASPYLAHAKGYPYAQVEFARDGTGRVLKQSGPGITHKMGGGHETRFFYGTANSTQLHRLFGSNVGKASHYQKHVSQDQNGQLSVAYLDQEGRTIATALAGEAPNNLEALGYNPYQLTVNLGGNNLVDVGEGILKSSNKIINAVPSTDYDFFYSMDGIMFDFQYTLPDGSTTPTLCHTCEYELIISITDEDGVPVTIPAGTGYNVLGGRLYTTYPSQTQTCQTPGYSSTPISFTVNFADIGTYRVEKTLRVMDPDLTTLANDYQVGDNYLAAQTAAAIADVPSNWCDETCEEHCASEAEAAGHVPGTSPFDAYVATCEATCRDFIDQTIEDSQAETCAGYLEQMRADISPDGGVYGNGGWLYLDDSFLEEPSLLADLANAGYPLTTAASIRSAWNQTIEDEVVLNHPEYCIYEVQCVVDQYREYIYQMSLVPDWPTAVANGFADPLGDVGNNTIPDLPAGLGTGNNDDQFALSPGTIYTNLQNELSDYRGSGESLYKWCDPVNGNNAADLYVGLTTAQEIDEQHWNLFRGAYIDLREREIEKQIIAPCAYKTYPQAIFKPIITVPDPVTDPLAFHSTVQSNLGNIDFGCEDICAENVLQWMDELENSTECELWSNLSPAQLTAISTALYDLCIASCGAENPLGLILNSHQSHPYFAALWNSVNGALDPANDPNALPDDCKLNLVSIVSPYTDTCKNSYRPQYLPRFGRLIEYINEHVLPNHLANSGTVSYSIGTYLPDYQDLVAWYNEEDVISDATDLTVTDNHLVKMQGKLVAGLFDVYGNPVDLSMITALENPVYDDFLPSGISADELNYVKLEAQTGTGTMDVYTTYGEADLLSGPAGEIVYEVCWVTDIQQPAIQQTDCEDFYTNLVTHQVEQWHNALVEDLKGAFLGTHRENCLRAQDHFYYVFDAHEYHYTLFYYDQAGNLVQTVPPEGVNPVDDSHFNSQGEWDGTEPQHGLPTNYAYNSLNQVEVGTMPDHDGASNSWYNEKGQLIASRDARQALQTVTDQGNTYLPYSYVRYDGLERPYESGVAYILSSQALATLTESQREEVLNSPDFPDQASYTDNGSAVALTVLEKREVVHTYYDEPINATVQAAFGANGQQFLRFRVASSTREEVDDQNDATYDYATHYSYDVHGNVDVMIQEDPSLAHLGQQYKTMHYDYDLFNGNVHEVAYQPGEADQFYHRYSYDADSRLTIAETSTDGEIWEKDAKYDYYLHGPLARVELGEDKVQGLDYTYTLQGWMKGVNSNTLNVSRDPSADGEGGTNLHAYNGRDAMGFTLGYFDGDYTGIGATAQFEANTVGSVLWNDNGTPYSLYNGNIGHAVIALTDETETALEVHGYRYRHDQLQRLHEMRTIKDANVVSSGTWNTAAAASDYWVETKYDGNGNIEELKRNGYGTNIAMDNMVYRYNKGSQGELLNNRLNHVNDIVTANNYSVDIKDQGVYNPVPLSTSSWNYGYDALGNLIRDNAEEIANIAWKQDGKIKGITRSLASDKDDLEFRYDLGGNRIEKLVKPRTANSGLDAQHEWVHTHYVRDGNGEPMATYERVYEDLGYQNGQAASYTLNVQGGSTSGTISLDVDAVTILATAVNWNSDANTTATDLATAINNFTSTPDYTAVANGSQVTISAATVGNANNGLAVTGSTTNIQTELQGKGPFLLAGGINAGNLYKEVLRLVEHPVYGSSRLGLRKETITVSEAQFTATLSNNLFDGAQQQTLAHATAEAEHAREMGQKAYELTNHQGNVLNTVNDQKTGVDGNADGTADHYLSDVKTYSDYYPFGMEMPGRHGGEDHRFGFQNQETDEELWNGSVTYKYRVEDPRLGRFFSVDPLSGKYPHNSTYAFSENSLIAFVELEGLERVAADDVKKIDDDYSADDNIGNFETGEYKLGKIDGQNTTLHKIISGVNAGNYVALIHRGDHSDLRDRGQPSNGVDYGLDYGYIFGADRVPEEANFENIYLEPMVIGFEHVKHNSKTDAYLRGKDYYSIRPEAQQQMLDQLWGAMLSARNEGKNTILVNEIFQIEDELHYKGFSGAGGLTFSGKLTDPNSGQELSITVEIGGLLAWSKNNGIMLYDTGWGNLNSKGERALKFGTGMTMFIPGKNIDTADDILR